jgi:hypothetical protein
MRVIDADGHVEENPITFSDNISPPSFARIARKSCRE